MEWAVVILAYLLGSVPSGVVAARLSGGPDPRTGGSGNIGATNVLRTLGRKAAVLTLAGDLFKGVLAVAAARVLLPQGSPMLYAAAGAAILGHDFSLFLRFKGGKGVATTFGALAALSPPVAGLVVVTWVTVAVVTRYASAASLSAAAMSPLFSLLTGRVRLAVFCLAAAALLWFLHRENLRRLWEGTEGRIGDRGD